MWSRFLELRDNGSLTIGSFIAILNPKPIQRYFCNEIPIVETGGGCIVMKMDAAISSIAVDCSIGSNETHAFVFNGVKVEIRPVSISEYRYCN